MTEQRKNFVEIPLNIQLSKEVGARAELGGEIEESGFFAQIHEQPIGIPLRRIFAKCGLDFTEALDRPESELFDLYSRFDLWLVPHTVSIIRRTGYAEPTCVGIEVEYKNEDRTCSIRSVLPSCRFLDHGHIRGTLALTGEMTSLNPPRESGTLTHEFFKLRLGATAHADLLLRFDSTVITPYISAVGENSSRCEWRFDKHKEPLFGRDINTWAIVALPKRQRSVTYDIRYYFQARTFFITHRYESAWTSLTCQLDA